MALDHSIRFRIHLHGRRPVREFFAFLCGVPLWNSVPYVVRVDAALAAAGPDYRPCNLLK